MTQQYSFTQDVRKIMTIILVFVILYSALAYVELRYQSLTWLADQVVPLIVKL